MYGLRRDDAASAHVATVMNKILDVENAVDTSDATEGSITIPLV